MAAGGTRWIEVVDIGCMKTKQLDLEANQTALAMYLLKLGPQLPEYAVFGYERLHLRVQRWSCHLCTCKQNCKWLATRLPFGTSAITSPGFNRCFSSGRTG
jgi:hypothetical protein